MTTPTEALKLAIDTQDAIRNFVGSHGQENTETFLMMEADRALSAVRSALAQQQASVPSVERAFDMLAHLKRQAEFSAKTFGPGARVEGVTDHIAKELREVRESGGDLSEWVDVIILAFDGAWRSGASPAQIIDAMVAKQTKNEGRKWPDWRTAPANKAIEHDRSGEVGPTPPPATATKAQADATASVAELFSPHQQRAMGIIQSAAAGIDSMRAEVWNAAIEAAALVVQPVPHIDEERTCGEVAAAIRALKSGTAPQAAPAPTTQPQAAMPVPIGWRPNVACTPPQHFNAGQPKQQDVDYWKSMGCGIEYAYGTTAPRAFAVPEPGTPWWQTAKDCGAWTDNPDGDVGYVHFGSVEALRVYTVKITKQAQAAQAQSVPATGAQSWRPIETAPKSSRVMFVVQGFNVTSEESRAYNYTTDPYCVWPEDGGWRRWPHQFQPTHWLPLPAAPTGDKA